MKLALQRADDAGLAVRALRKGARVRIDDFAQLARVSKQFMTDLENGKPTLQIERVLQVLAQLGVRVTLELPDDAQPALEIERRKRDERRARQRARAARADD